MVSTKAAKKSDAFFNMDVAWTLFAHSSPVEFYFISQGGFSMGKSLTLERDVNMLLFFTRTTCLLKK